jgi:oligoendopeptidase F
MKIIKRGILEKKENFRKEMREYEAQKEKIDSLFSQKISLDKAIHLAIEIFNKIDKSLGKFVLNSFQKGLVDVYPKKNKYLLPRVASVTRSKFLPTFILLNYNNTLQDFLSLIHEFSHSLHNEFLKKYNSPLNSAQSEIVKETVTAIFVLFALETLKEKYDKELIEKKIKGEGAQRILYDMAIFSTQEEIYKIFKKKGKVKIKEINKIYKKNVSLFLGKDKAKEFSDYRWILNFYRGLAFWHFPYFLGNLLSRIFIKEYYRNKKEFKEKLFKLMQAGLNKFLKEILKEIKIINHL